MHLDIASILMDDHVRPGAPPYCIFPRIWLIKIHPSSTIPAPNANTSRCKLVHFRYMFSRPHTLTHSSLTVARMIPYCLSGLSVMNFHTPLILKRDARYHFLTFHILFFATKKDQFGCVESSRLVMVFQTDVASGH